MKTKLALACGLCLTSVFTTIAPAVDLIPFGAEWSYMHPTNGVNPADADADFDTTWFLGASDFTANYNGPEFGAAPALTGPPIDSGVGAAPIGYGEINYIDDELGGFATALTEPADDSRFTAYFRHEFVVGADVDNLALDIIVDDGAALYIDGVLWQRINFTEEDTYTADTSAADENDLQTITFGLGGLSAGPHVLAMSVHQTNPDSSDLGFDLRLSDEGTATAQMGTTSFDSVPGAFFLNGTANGWMIDGDSGRYLLDNADGGTIMSESVNLAGRTGVVFTMDFALDETSGASNFEADDRIAMWLEVEILVATLKINLTPFGYDANQDGAITGDEIFPDLEGSQRIDLRHAVAAEIPDNAVSARLVIEGINDSTTEMFRFRNAHFTDAPTDLILGTNEKSLVPPTDLKMVVGPNAWVEDSPKVFSLNDADSFGGGRVLASEKFELGLVDEVSVSLDLEVDVTSLNTNLENSDTFAAWVEVIDTEGVGSVYQLVSGGTDANGNHVLEGDEFAPGADPTQALLKTINLGVNLPSNAAEAQLFIAAEVNAANETLRISNVVVGDPLAEPESFQIVDISHGAGTSYDITFDSTPGNSYFLEFSPDLTDGSFVSVANVTGGGGSTTTTNHDPGADAEGFYRVSTAAIVIDP